MELKGGGPGGRNCGTVSQASVLLVRKTLATRGRGTSARLQYPTCRYVGSRPQTHEVRPVV